ncbi:MAG: type II toxin-antitoxin system RelE/ParE family toxin [Phycisphaerales bacterium]|nr:type II toxin-antitoxin system RelE/ParE family toxin [Phycisphaerales bacterium]
MTERRGEETPRQPRIKIYWTETAKQSLKRLPAKVRRGLLEKADGLLTSTDPRSAHKPLTGPLSGCYRITYGRYRAIYTVRDDGEGVSLTFVVIFVAAGIRRERSKDDIYRLAEKLIDLGLAGELPEREGKGRRGGGGS